MKYLFLVLAFYSSSLIAQSSLRFNKRFVQCEDKWVAYQRDKDSTYTYGFIYIDSQAGLTYQNKGRFKITDDNTFVSVKDALDTISLKVRLQPNNVKVAIIPDDKLKELQLPEFPDWLQYYKTDTGTIERLFRWGYLYNSWDECDIALPYLERGYKMNPDFKGLAFELAYAYNALDKCDKAITVLETALATHPNECYMYKELSYAQIHTGQLDKAAITCKKGIGLCTDKSMKAEIAINLAQGYYKLKDKTNFKYWAKETRKWATKGDDYTSSINKMEADMDK